MIWPNFGQIWASLRRARALFRVKFRGEGGQPNQDVALTAGNPTVAVARRGTHHQPDDDVARL
jgi:hypothetical protein